jgi:hypothetical protein
MDIVNTILKCSGECGLENYKNMPLEKFIKWFENDISFNTAESKKLGKELISFLSRSQQA